MALHPDSYPFFLPSAFLLDRMPFWDRVSHSWDPLSRAFLCRVAWHAGRRMHLSDSGSGRREGVKSMSASIPESRAKMCMAR